MEGSGSSRASRSRDRTRSKSVGLASNPQTDKLSCTTVSKDRIRKPKARGRSRSLCVVITPLDKEEIAKLSRPNTPRESTDTSSDKDTDLHNGTKCVSGKKDKLDSEKACGIDSTKKRNVAGTLIKKKKVDLAGSSQASGNVGSDTKKRKRSKVVSTKMSSIDSPDEPFLGFEKSPDFTQSVTWCKYESLIDDLELAVMVWNTKRPHLSPQHESSNGVYTSDSSDAVLERDVQDDTSQQPIDELMEIDSETKKEIEVVKEEGDKKENANDMTEKVNEEDMDKVKETQEENNVQILPEESIKRTNEAESIPIIESSPEGGSETTDTKSDSTETPIKGSPKLSTGRSKKVVVDINNPAFRKPLELGWKRELVYRNTSDTTIKRNADIYYYTPSGKKVRSNREVVENLDGKDLTLSNFTFHKGPLGIDDPQKEIIRDAKKVSQKVETPGKKSLPKTKSPKENLLKTTLPVEEKEPEQCNSEEAKVTVPDPKDKPIPRTFPRIKVTPLRSTSLPMSKALISTKQPLLSKQSPTKKRYSFTKRPLSKKQSPTNKSASRHKCDDEESDGELEMGMLPPMWKDSSSSSRTSTNILVSADSAGSSWSDIRPTAAKKYEPCSIRCADVMGIIPSLQCRLCLCLYHPECVGLGSITDTIHSYVCKKCQQEIKDGKSAILSTSKLLEMPSGSVSSVPSSTSPPPLTPISTLGVGNSSSGNGVGILSPPKLQRLPRPVDQTGKFYTVPRYVKVPQREVKLIPPPVTKSTIVGSVTTWLPPSSTIQLTSTNVATTKPSVTSAVSPVSGSPSTSVPMSTVVAADGSAIGGSPPAHTQFLACMAGKRYIVVPKHNVLSVSPAMAATPTSPTSKASAVGLVDSTPFGDKAPTSLGDTSPHQHPVSQPQVLMGAASSGGDLIPASFAANGPGGPILPKPSTTATYLQNPPGVLLVPVVPGSPLMPGADSSQQQQYVLVNGPPGGFLFGNMASPLKSITGSSGDVTKQRMQFFMMNMSSLYSAMKTVFEYFKVQDLLCAARVCRMWRDLADCPSLWRTVRMKNSQVVNWKGCAEALHRHGTQHLDLRKMLLTQGNEDTWDDFCNAIGIVQSLRELHLCRCPAMVVERVATACPRLELINALSIKGLNINLNVWCNFRHLQELRLRSLGSIQLTCKLEVLKELVNLKNLSLTTFKSLGMAEPNTLKVLTNLESLELGEIYDFPENWGTECLIYLVKLQRLRLEKGQSNCTINILNAVQELPALVQLEMINFDVHPGFHIALVKCINIRRLLLIPTYVTQSATTNHMVLCAILRMSNTLEHCEWGVTHELLRVTELFVDQCHEHREEVETAPDFYAPRKNPENDSIPVLRPVPGLVGGDEDDIQFDFEEGPPPSAAAVDIVKISTLLKQLHDALPNTMVRILKMPFQATWRQCLSESKTVQEVKQSSEPNL